MARRQDKNLYFMEQTDGAFNTAYDAYCPAATQFKSFNSTGTTTTMEMQFDSSLGEGADIAACDSVLLTITANTHKAVIAAITKLLADAYSDPMVVICDASNEVFAHANITACAITLASPA